MKRIYWLIQSLFNPPEEDKARKKGLGEYLAEKGIPNEINEPIHMIEGEAVIKLDKHLNKI